MISGPQTSATVASGSKRAEEMSFGTTPTLPSQSASAASTVTSTCRSKRPRRRCELVAVQEVGRRAAAVEQRDLAVLGAVLQDVVERRPQGREPDAAGDDDDVAADGLLDRPRVPERPAYAQHRSRSRGADGLRDRPTARTVCTSGPSVAPETEIGTSPMPNT